jgi:hypothetical protein
MLKIERDKVYIDGRGNRFRVVCVDATTEAHGYPVIGINDAGDVNTFTSEGRAYFVQTSERDLVREVKVRYVNIYPTHVSPYVCKLDAEDCAGTGRLACIRVEYEEDQFDD